MQVTLFYVIVSNNYWSTTFSLQSLSVLGGQNVQATVYCEFFSSDYNSEMQLSVGEANQIGYDFGCHNVDLVVKL